jgi:hydroxyacylglutathione hydrolase
MFEGTAQQMWGSLEKLMALPDETVVYCAHEYTQANAAFAITVEPDNSALQQRTKDIARLREQGIPTVPTTIGLERQTNPFVRPQSDNLQRTIDCVGADAVAIFAETRKRKDNF